MKKIYWRWHKINISRRMWIEGWLGDQFEVISNADFENFSSLCRRLGIVFEEAEEGDETDAADAIE